MNQSTQRKIAKAIEKLGETASYRKIAAEAGVSIGMIQRYKKVYTPNCIQQEVYTSEVVTPESAPLDTIVTRPEIGEAIKEAKKRIGWPESGVFPTTARLMAETGYTAGEIDVYFENRMPHNDSLKPLLRGMQYTGPLPARPYYGPIQINMKGDWRPRRIGEARVGSF